MQKIASFTINHDKLLPGIYISRKDQVGAETITTVDLRIRRPNIEPCMSTAELHTLEHLCATYLRNDPEWSSKVIYFGPMGCRTGCYLLLAGDYESKELVPLITKTFEFVRDFEGTIPGTVSTDCGNYLDHNLEIAKYFSRIYLETLYHIQEENLIYPEI